MAKASKAASKAAKVENSGAKASAPRETGNSTYSAAKAEEKAAKSEGKNPNELENKYASRMTRSQAEAVLVKYDGINGGEVPPELQQARATLKAAKE